jgi:hypothetical protein
MRVKTTGMPSVSATSVTGRPWKASTGTTVESFDLWTIGGGDGIEIALTRSKWLGESVVSPSEMWITTDGKTWRDTGSKFIVTDTGEHGGAPSFCIGAGRLVTIVSDGKQTRAYYADLLQ